MNIKNYFLQFLSIFRFCVLFSSLKWVRKIFHSLILVVKWLKWKVLFIQKKFCYSKMDINYSTIFILQFTNEQFVKVTISSFDEADPSSTFCRKVAGFHFFTTVLSTYRSQTAVLFQRPCCFNSSKPIPFSLSSVADVRRKECPENSSTLGSSRKCSYEARNRCHTIHSDRLFAEFTGFCSRPKQSSVFCFNYGSSM